MKSPAKKIVIAIISGALFLNAGLLFAKSHEVIYCQQENNLQANEDGESSERRQEFWKKFRESVKPREKKPPKEVHPNEVKNKETVPKEIQ